MELQRILNSQKKSWERRTKLKNVYFAAVGWNILSKSINLFDLRYSLIFANWFSVWMIYPLLEAVLIKSTTIIVLHLFLQSGLLICFIYLGSPMLGTCIFTNVASFIFRFTLLSLYNYLFLNLSIALLKLFFICFLSIAPPAFFWLSFTWNYLLQCFILICVRP